MLCTIFVSAEEERFEIEIAEAVVTQIYMVTAPCDDLLSRIERAVLGGVRFVQLRNKKASDEAVYEQGLNIRTVLNTLASKGYKTSFIVNDRWLVAKELQAGLHVGWEDLLRHCGVSEEDSEGCHPLLKSTLKSLKKSLPDKALLGLTIHDKVARAANFTDELNYVGVGPVFRTQTKADAKAVLGTEHFRWVVNKSPVPVVGIGGISISNIAALKSSGAMALALCSAFFAAADPKNTSERMIKILRD